MVENDGKWWNMLEHVGKSSHLFVNLSRQIWEYQGNIPDKKKKQGLPPKLSKLQRKDIS